MALPDRQRVFRIVDNSGEHFIVSAESYSEAYEKFRDWEKHDYDPGDDIEDVQSVCDAGWLIKERNGN